MRNQTFSTKVHDLKEFLRKWVSSVRCCWVISKLYLFVHSFVNVQSWIAWRMVDTRKASAKPRRMRKLMLLVAQASWPASIPVVAKSSSTGFFFPRISFCRDKLFSSGRFLVGTTQMVLCLQESRKIWGSRDLQVGSVVSCSRAVRVPVSFFQFPSTHFYVTSCLSQLDVHTALFWGILLTKGRNR